MNFNKINWCAMLRALTIDALAITGISLVSYGAYLIYEPACYITVGLSLIAVSFLGRE